MKRTIKYIISSVLGGFSTLASADFLITETIGVFDWIPSDETRNSSPYVNAVTDFKLHSIRVTEDASRKVTIKVLLPEDLSAGKPVWASLTEVSRNPEINEIVFAGESGTAICGADESWQSGSCDVRLTSLPPISPVEMREFIEKKYAGTSKLNGMEVVAKAFGAEPFGRFQILDRSFEAPGSELGNGVWQTMIRENGGSWQPARAHFDFERGTVNAESLLPGSQHQSSILRGLRYENFELFGTFNMDFESSRWFRIRFSDDTFEGVWGYEENPAIPLGEWRGHR
jgi:hypothetical protein